jgi:hypothetical protein
VKTYVAEIDGEAVLAFRTETMTLRDASYAKRIAGFRSLSVDILAFFVSTDVRCGTARVRSGID